ncbi:hypothetical protein [Stenotrophomonas tumulicola]|uniref:Uncharacterized protein n=1 Tax=Stenotrophomonas tumulicola TaxID=1685415 RepID=A0A7W3FJN9_9GAMM|nr:hypothetical protein [Stenotrophomonas tumulicola]MBA8680476.1 hypothetical protein [Stenotrophomonas tumulicola]
MNDLPTAAVEKLTAQLGEALFKEPGLDLFEIANRCNAEASRVGGALLAATGKQQVGEVQGDALAAFNECLTPALRVPETAAYRIAVLAAVEAIAARQPVGQEPLFYAAFHGQALYGVYEDGKEALKAVDRIGNLGSMRCLYAAPPAQDVDLGQFRDAVELMEWQERGHDHPDFPQGNPEKHAEAVRLLALIDSQAGVKP